MPMKWVEPELLLVHNGVAVWHTYRDEDVVSEYWYTLIQAEDNIDGGDSQFDVRDLPAYRGGVGHKEVVKLAIDAGYFQDWEKDEPPDEPPTFRSHEIGSIYGNHLDRFVVSLIATYEDDDKLGATNPNAAAAAALALVNDGDCHDTVWHVFDRKTQTMHEVIQGDFDNGER